MQGSYTIPRHLDDPATLFFWSADTVMMVVLFFILGTLMNLTVYLTVLGVFTARCWSRVRADNGAELLVYLFYWYSPFWLPLRPPSHIREYNG